MAKILCVEDSPEIALTVQKALRNEHEVIVAKDLQSARSLLDSHKIHLILMDIELPDGDGIRFVAELAEDERCKNIPVIMLTARSSIQDKTVAFHLGIEDYISKPFDVAEFKLRVGARLQKLAKSNEMAEQLSFGNLYIHLGKQKAYIQTETQKEEIDLSATELRILSFLVKYADHVKSREQIISYTWTDGHHISDRTVDSHISRIRKKIVKSNCMIEAVSGLGYKLQLPEHFKQTG